MVTTLISRTEAGLFCNVKGPIALLTNSAKKIRIIVSCAVMVAFVAGCEAPLVPYVPKALVAPQVVHCNDHTGHKAGSKPWIMGGTCTCTPTDTLMTQLHADGFAKGMSTADLRAMYEKEGIKLRGPGHMWCNGICDAGPHVVLAGKCMAPPVPGTEYYERVVLGPVVKLDVAKSSK